MFFLKVNKYYKKLNRIINKIEYSDTDWIVVYLYPYLFFFDEYKYRYGYGY